MASGVIAKSSNWYVTKFDMIAPYSVLTDEGVINTSMEVGVNANIHNLTNPLTSNPQ